MDNVEVSENAEAGIVLAGTVAGAVTAFLAAVPLPAEWKAPLVALSGSISAGVLAYWKLKVNKQTVLK